MNDFTPLSSLAGGLLIGLAASVLLLFNGRIAGVSGILGGVVTPVAGDIAWRLWFLGGLVAGGLVLRLVRPDVFPAAPTSSLAVILAAGFLVGLGTRLGGGCTSGHGVCGLSRLSVRSLAATLTFMTGGALTVLLVRHVLGGAR
jgi:uncharacterized membrane protein YedE/YeeE